MKRSDNNNNNNNNSSSKNSLALVRKRTIPTERPPLVGEMPTFADRGCHVVSVTDPYGRILGFLDRSRH
jgi:CBS-domain-containing membrane protein